MCCFLMRHGVNELGGVDPVDAERNEPTEGDPFCTSMSDCDV